ncbi:hypothetical protein [Nocardioides sp. Leaf285]|uniref:hypothetical protein n=1 Tax=Nocardioides sp. Leaf285 TaxID=1736322 RepID=UPI0007030667|nr:hypothetical protein [Nocardioides sp. Leaf285]KQP63179.1 hypothetical protein ASF47_19405 [Nocardioides sp. Leaf285]
MTAMPVTDSVTDLVTDAATGRTGLVAARPRSGHLVHVIRDQPLWRAKMGLGRLVIYARPLCYGNRVGELLASRPGSTSMRIVGGHSTPTEPSVALEQSSTPCPTCARRLADPAFPV